MASIVLPGEHVPAQHVNLKLGPGLVQLSAHRVSPNGQPIISARAGQLHHSANNSRWWVEGNARRVSFLRAVSTCTCDHFHLVRPSTPRERDRCRPRSQRRGMACGHWLRTSCAARWTRIRRCHQEEQTQPQSTQFRPSFPYSINLLCRLVLWFTLACPSHTRTWSPNWNVSMLKHTKPKVSVSSVVGLSSNVVCGCVGCEYFTRSNVLPRPCRRLQFIGPKTLLAPLSGLTLSTRGGRWHEWQDLDQREGSKADDCRHSMYRGCRS